MCKEGFFMRILSFIVLVFSANFSVLGQVKERNVPEVEVVGTGSKSRESGLDEQSLNRAEILKLQPEDLGQLLQKFAGTNVKNYGGLGGLKTISVRSLGGPHTVLVVDGFPIQNTQLGQLNLGQIQTDNIETLNLQIGKQQNELFPISAQVSGSSISITTFENSFSSEQVQLRSASKLGSFGQVDNYAGLKFNRKGTYFSVYGKYRSADGNYPYAFKNGTLAYAGTRVNNDLVDGYAGASLGIRLGKKGQLKASYRYSSMDQGLPGVVILYNNTSFQRLISENKQATLDYSYFGSSWSYRIYGSGGADFMNYSDPSFLNATGGISTNYLNQSALLGGAFKGQLFPSFSVFGGVETRYSLLHVSIPDFSIPERLHNYMLLGGSYTYDQWSLEGQLSSQYVLEKNDQGKSADNQQRFNPYVSVERGFKSPWNWKIKTWYRNSFRMPTFNELYYNGIGNVKLKPEDANQFSVGVSANPLQKRSNLTFTFNVYYNRVQNQILAIPTKNLFIWSMQNIGRVEAMGSELLIHFSHKWNDRWSLSSTVNYSLQRSVDISNRQSVTYKHQVPYIPIHSGNYDIMIQRKMTGIRLSSYFSSKRYSLNENISSNEVPGFGLLDISIFSEFKTTKGHSFRLQASLKNSLNSSYAFVRYYVMPGRNYLVSISYAFH
jgi:vitamin B12 transporter